MRKNIIIKSVPFGTLFCYALIFLQIILTKKLFCATMKPTIRNNKNITVKNKQEKPIPKFIKGGKTTKKKKAENK